MGAVVGGLELGRAGQIFAIGLDLGLEGPRCRGVCGVYVDAEPACSGRLVGAAPPTACGR
jgi:hypothetical protein